MGMGAPSEMSTAGANASKSFSMTGEMVSPGIARYSLGFGSSRLNPDGFHKVQDISKQKIADLTDGFSSQQKTYVHAKEPSIMMNVSILPKRA